MAGLADQPIRNVISNQTQTERSSSSSAASGIVTGMGKGLVGMVTKPIGGAAEFVSQTGQGNFFSPQPNNSLTGLGMLYLITGILHGTGFGMLYLIFNYRHSTQHWFWNAIFND